MGAMTDLDPADRRLLALLQTRPRASLAELCEAAALSTAAVQRRLRRLRAEVIREEAAVIDPEAAGFPIVAIVSVELERDRGDHLDAFYRAARAEPQVMTCDCVTGETDFVLRVVARSLADFEALTVRLLYHDSNVRKFRSSIVIRTGKDTRALPME